MAGRRVHQFCRQPRKPQRVFDYYRARPARRFPVEDFRRHISVESCSKKREVSLESMHLTNPIEMTPMPSEERTYSRAWYANLRQTLGESVCRQLGIYE